MLLGAACLIRRESRHSGKGREGAGEEDTEGG
jgi:hypothetical protein